MRPPPPSHGRTAPVGVLAVALALAPTSVVAQEPVAPPPEPPPSVSGHLALGFASLSFADATGARVARGGVALELRGRHRVTPRLGFDATLTWGLTDWGRAREWIEAGNAAGRWTTDRIRAVGDWAMDDDKTRGVRLMGAAFADLFLGATYAAVPVCYVGSLGGATSHLQLDVTANLHPVDGPIDAWVEGGLGAMALPTHLHDWDAAFGTVVGVGADLGPIRVGARLFWSPPALHGGTLIHGTLLASAVTVAAATP